MLKTLLIISTFYVAALASSRLTILTFPNSLSFKGNDRLECESLADVFAASLGYPVAHPSDWTGLYINNPFNPAKGVVTVVVDGLEEFKHIESEKTHSYELNAACAQESLDSLVFRVLEQNEVAIDLDLTEGFDVLDQYTSILGDIKPSLAKTVSALKPSDPAEKLFLEQVAIIDSLSDKIEELNEEHLPKYITIRLSLQQLIKSNGLASPAVTDAKKRLASAIDRLTASSQKAYNNGAVVAAVTVADDTVARTKRAAGAEVKSDPIPENLNLALSYSDDYPVIFNIILWFSVVLTFSLLAISYTIGYMDPGRDSIIYRMTSTRMKKDN